MHDPIPVKEKEISKIMPRITFEEPFSKKKAELIGSLIAFSLNHLTGDACRKTRIHVIFERGLIKHDGFAADLTADSLDGTGEFTIRLDSSMELKSMLTYVAHECVHIKQYVLGEVTESLPPKNYWDDPLEIEAYGRELGLFVRWVVKYGHTKKKWASAIF